MRGRTIRAALAAAALLAGAAAAQEPDSRPTREFVQAAAQSDEFELLEATTVLAESRDRDVRAFAEEMLRAHHGTSAALAQAAARAGLKPPPRGLGGDQAQLLAALPSLRGRDFDQAYLRHQVLAHRAALVTEQGYAATGDDPAIRQAASSTVPLISSHLAMAEQLRARMGGS